MFNTWEAISFALMAVIIIGIIVHLVLEQNRTKGIFKVKRVDYGKTFLNAILWGTNHKVSAYDDKLTLVATEKGIVSFKVNSIGKNHLYIENGNDEQDNEVLVNHIKQAIDRVGAGYVEIQGFKTPDTTLVINDLGPKSTIRMTYDKDHRNVKMMFIADGGE